MPAVHRYAEYLYNSASVICVMGDCKPPLADIRNCNHGRRESPVDENGDPHCQCGLDEKAKLMIEEGIWDGKTGSEPREGWWDISWSGRGGIVHRKTWERKKSNRRHTLRIDESVLNALRGKKNNLGIETRGRPKWKGREPKRQKKKNRRPGGPARGNSHLMRAQTLRVMKKDIGMIVKLLEKARVEAWRPGKRKSVVLYMPNMELAMEELLDELNEISHCRTCNRMVEMKGLVRCPYCGEGDKKKFKKGLEGEHLLSKEHAQSGWAPTLCRLIEICAIFEKEVRAEVLAQERFIEPENPDYATKEEEFYEREVGKDPWSFLRSKD